MRRRVARALTQVIATQQANHCERWVETVRAGPASLAVARRHSNGNRPSRLSSTGSRENTAAAGALHATVPRRAGPDGYEYHRE